MRKAVSYIFKYSFWGVITAICILIFYSCKKSEQIKDYTRDNSGFYYKLISIGDGNDNPVLNNVLVFDAVMSTQSDSVFWDTEHDGANGLFVVLTSNFNSGSCNRHFLKMVQGDSLSFLVKPSVFFREYFDTIVPAFCKNDSLVKLNVRLTEIISKAEYQSLLQNSEGNEKEDTELQELSQIDAYAAKYFPLAKVDENGIYMLEKTSTNNEYVSSGKKVKLSFQGYFLDGKPVDRNEQIIEFVFGTPDQMVKGLNIVIGTLKKGETTKIIVPSRLAFGEVGSTNGSVPPYTPLVYNIKIIDIK